MMVQKSQVNTQPRPYQWCYRATRTLADRTAKRRRGHVLRSESDSGSCRGLRVTCKDIFHDSRQPPAFHFAGDEGDPAGHRISEIVREADHSQHALT